jgi:hypothetical protein
MTGPNLVSYAAAALIVALVIIFRMSRMRRTRRLNVTRFWIAPAIFLFLAVTTLAQFPPQGSDWAWLTMAAAAGGALGWQRGRLMDIRMDPESKALTTQASPMAIFFLLGLLVVRLVLRAGLQMEAQNGGLSASLVTDLFIVFAAALFTLQQVEMSIRARRLLSSIQAP